VTGWEHVLPAPFSCRVWILSFQCIWQIDVAETILEIRPVPVTTITRVREGNPANSLIARLTTSWGVRFVRFDLLAHLLHSCNKSFDLLLLLRELCAKVLLLLRDDRFQLQHLTGLTQDSFRSGDAHARLSRMRSRQGFSQRS